MSDNITKNVREFTDMERRYVNAYVTRRTWLQRILGGVILVCLSSFLVCIIALIFDIDRFGSLAWVFFVTQFVCFGGVNLLLRKFKVRGSKHKVDDSISEVSGRFEELSFTVSTGNGGSETKYRHFIGDVELIFPPGARPAFLGMHGREVTLSGVLWHNLGDVEFSRYTRKFMPEAAARVPAIQLLVLEWHGLIDVDGVLEKYGKHYFLQYRAKNLCEALFFVVVLAVVCGFPLLFDFYIDLYIDRSMLVFVPLGLVHLFGSIAISILIFLNLAKAYVALRKRQDPDYDTTPHEERLKGHG